MKSIRPRVRPALAILAAACLGPATVADAQGFGADPFRPYNSQYDPYVFGARPGMLDAGGNISINRQGVRHANQFQEAMEAGLSNSNRYDRAYRAHDESRKRIYRPNAEADKNYEARRAKASDIYFQYLYERDPRKRAALFKEYAQARSDVARGLANDPNARGARRGRADAIPPAPSGRRADESGADAGAIPAAPAGLGTRPETRPRGRRAAPPTGASAVPPAPAGDDPTPSEILDRASRSGRPAPTGRRLP